jgi:hypothetical protein
MAGNTLEQMRARYEELKPRYVADDPTLDPTEIEQLAVELNEFHQLTNDRAEERMGKQYPRGTLNHVDPTIFQDFNP